MLDVVFVIGFFAVMMAAKIRLMRLLTVGGHNLLSEHAHHRLCLIFDTFLLLHDLVHLDLQRLLIILKLLYCVLTGTAAIRLVHNGLRHSLGLLLEAICLAQKMLLLLLLLAVLVHALGGSAIALLLSGKSFDLALYLRLHEMLFTLVILHILQVHL